MREINSGEGEKIGEICDSERMEKKEKIKGKDSTREEEQIERGRKRRLPTRLKETYREAWEEIDRDCKRNSEEEDEKELKLNYIKLQNQSEEELQREKI